MTTNVQSQAFRDDLVDKTLSMLDDLIAGVEKRAHLEDRVLKEIAQRLGISVGEAVSPPQHRSNLLDAWKPIVSRLVVATVRALCQKAVNGKVILTLEQIELVTSSLDTADMLQGTGLAPSDLPTVLRKIGFALRDATEKAVVALTVDGQIYQLSWKVTPGGKPKTIDGTSEHSEF